MLARSTSDRYTVPKRILACLGVYLIVDLMAVSFWSSAGPAFSLQAPADTSSLPVTAMAAVGCWLCLRVLRGFPAGAPLRPAWVLLALASGAQAISGGAAEIFGSYWILNPLVWTGQAQPGLMQQIQSAAVVLAGPLRLAALAGAVPIVVRILSRFGFRGRLGAIDWALCGVIGLFTLCRFAEGGTGTDKWISVAELLLLCILLVEAMFLLRALGRMGNGPVAKCWSALVWGVFSAGLGALALWLIPHYSRSPLGMLESLWAFLTAAIFALAPAYQLAAQSRATTPAGNSREELATASPAVAR